MFNQTSNLVSSHVMSGWVTPHVQSVGYPFGYGSLLNQEASNAFPPFHYWKPCLIERFINPTAILNFSSYLPVLIGLCLSLTIQGIRAVFITRIYGCKLFKLLESRAQFLSVLKYRVSATPAPRRTK